MKVTHPKREKNCATQGTKVQLNEVYTISE